MWSYSPIVAFPEVFTQRPNIQRLDVGGIYVLNTNSVQTNDKSIDYGVNPNLYNELPCECLILLQVHEAVPSSCSNLPVTLAIPYRGNATTTTSSDDSGNNTINIVDSQGSNVLGCDIESNTQRFAYLNKRTGTMRFLEFTSSASSTKSTDTTTN